MQKFALIAALVLTTVSAQAAEISFSIIEANWFANVGGNITYNNPLPRTTDTLAQIRWGTEAFGSQSALAEDSGYDFQARSTVFTESTGSVWNFGTFTHFNRPITAGTAIDSVDLHITSSFSIDDGTTVTNYDNVDFGFRFQHDETANGAKPCLYPSGGNYLQAPGGGNVNANGCADLVTVVPLDNNFVSPDGLTLNLLGFSDSIANANNGIFFDSFLSGEGGNNSATLTASFWAPDDGSTPGPGLAPDPAPPPDLAPPPDPFPGTGTGLAPEINPAPGTVPAPAPMTLMAFGLLGLGIMRRGRRRNLATTERPIHGAFTA